jgi:hypothetical protein
LRHQWNPYHVCSNPLPDLYSWQLDAFFNAVENWKSKWTCVYSSTLCLRQTTENGRNVDWKSCATY